MNKNFLSKKSWHTGSMQHMEKVWKAEQRKLEEDKKVEELRRQKEKERQMHELLDAQTGGRKRVERLDWMYRGQAAAGTSTEEFLLGKEVKVKEEEKVDFTTPALFQEQAISATQDTWMKLQEDPLLSIKRQEKESLEYIRNNPMKMKMLKERVEKMRKEKKKRKKEKKSAEKADPSRGPSF